MSDMPIPDELREKFVMSLIKSLVRCSDLPDWMQFPALGRDMRPLAEYLADRLLNSSAILEEGVYCRGCGFFELVDLDEDSCAACGCSVTYHVSAQVVVHDV